MGGTSLIGCGAVISCYVSMCGLHVHTMDSIVFVWTVQVLLDAIGPIIPARGALASSSPQPG